MPDVPNQYADQSSPAAQNSLSQADILAGASPTTLPAVGMTTPQLSAYILRSLGGGIWNVELTGDHVRDAIQDAITFWSIQVPQLRLQSIRAQRNIFKYLEGVNMGFGIIRVDFVDVTPAPTEIFYGNLITPAPLFRAGLDEYDSFLRWRKTWKRVTSIEPDWVYDDFGPPERRFLAIYNPLEQYHVGVQSYHPYAHLEDIPYEGVQWVKRYALAKAKLTYGEVLAKFGGAIPAPLKDLQLDQQKRDQAQAQVDKLEAEAFGRQRQGGLIID